MDRSFFDLVDSELEAFARLGAATRSIPSEYLDGVVEVLRGLHVHAMILAAGMRAAAEDVVAPAEGFEP